MPTISSKQHVAAETTPGRQCAVHACLYHLCIFISVVMVYVCLRSNILHLLNIISTSYHVLDGSIYATKPK